jgi:hypothetical protein
VLYRNLGNQDKILVFGHSANNADKYIKYNKLSDGNWQFIIDNFINWQSVCMSRPLAIKHFLYMYNVFNFVLLGQLTFNYFKMHLLNNQLCLYLTLCLCNQLYAIYMYAKNWACTPNLPAMIIVQHCSHSKQISSSRNIWNIFAYMQHISGVSFFRLYLKSFKPLFAAKEILILDLEY